MQEKFLKIVELVFFVIIFCGMLFCIIHTYKYYQLDKEFQQYRQSIELQKDSLLMVNDSITNHLKEQLNQINDLQQKVDSLHQVKQEIIIQKESFKVSDNILEGVKILKSNLSCVELD